MSDKPDLSVVLPTLDESDGLKVLLPRLKALFEKLGVRGEVLVVDGGSKDDTAAVAALGPEGFERLGRVRAVGVHEHHAVRGGGREALAHGGAEAAALLAPHARAVRLGDGGGVVLGAAVDDQQLAAHAQLLEKRLQPRQDRLEPVGLDEGGQDDGEVGLVAHRRNFIRAHGRIEERP